MTDLSLQENTFLWVWFLIHGWQREVRTLELHFAGALDMVMVCERVRQPPSRYCDAGCGRVQKKAFSLTVGVGRMMKR